MAALIIVGIVVCWLFCGWASYKIGIAAWLYTFDLTRGDRLFFRVMTVFGPFMLVVITFVWLMSRPSKHGDEVLVERHPHAR